MHVLIRSVRLTHRGQRMASARLDPIQQVRYESVIHEFDPYFNFRTTKFLATEGFLDFLNWFDDRGWYPLGRTIGGTIYPGLMATAASIYWILHAVHITINIRNMWVSSRCLLLVSSVS